MKRHSVATVASYWMEKADASLASARDELAAGRHSFAVSRSYYAAFYAASATLLTMGLRFVKHSGVRGALHAHLVKPGLLAADLGRAYDRLFQDRQEGDYLEFTSFSDDETHESIAQAEAVVRRLREIEANAASDVVGS